MKQVDFSEYIRAPRINVVSGIVLGVRLIRAVHGKPISARALQFLGVVHDKTGQVQKAAQGRQLRSGGARYQDRRFDAAWGGVYRRVHSFARMVGEPEQPKAEQLLERLFPTGLSFTQASYEAEWVHAGVLLERIEHEELGEALVELVGERFTKLITQTHAELGEALGLDAKPEPSEPVAVLGDELRELAGAISDYARIFAGEVVDDESLALFEAALQPLADHRARARRGSGETEGDAAELDEDFDLDEPLPALPELE